MALHRFAFRAMAAEHELLLDAPSEAEAARAAQAAIADVARIEAKYSRYRDDSVTSAINAVQTWVLTALALVPTKVLILHNCLSALKNSSTCHLSL